MAVVDHVDGPNRLIYLHADTANTSIEPVDIYKEVRALRANDESLRYFDAFLSGHGHEDKGGGDFTDPYVKVLLGTKIIPSDVTGFLTITGMLLSDVGTSGIDCFDTSSLSNNVVINYMPDYDSKSAAMTYSVSLAGKIHLDVEYGNDASENLGILSKPVKSLEKAMELGVAENISDYHIGGTLILDRDVSTKAFTSQRDGRINLNGKLVNATRFYEVKMWGECNGLILAKDCRLENITNMYGKYENCELLPTQPITLASNQQTVLYTCVNAKFSEDIIFNLAGLENVQLYAYGYYGRIAIINSTHAGNVIKLNFAGGMLNLNSSNTAGSISSTGMVNNINDSAMIFVDGSVATETNTKKYINNASLRR